MKRFTTAVPCNRMCLWYKAGDMKRKPDLALVTNSVDDGMLDLTIFGVRARQECVNGVRHKDDPFLVKRPQHAKDNGCWDYLPYFKPSAKPPVTEQVEEDPLPATKPIVADQEVKDQVTNLLSRGMSSPEIAEELTKYTGNKWSYQRVNALMRQMPQPEEVT